MPKAPVSSTVLVGVLMLTFFGLCLVLTFRAALVWWLGPAVFAAIAAIMVTRQVRRRSRMRAVLNGVRL